MKECIFYKKLNSEVQCLACRRKCVIKEGQTGFCGVRKNVNGKLYLLVYEFPIAVNLDPIEKKPLFHFYPGSIAVSIGTVGCNFVCPYCCNYDISQEREIYGFEVKIEEIIEEAKRVNADGFSYTYNEPTIFCEFAFDIAKEAKKLGMYNMFVSNGYLSEELLQEIPKYLDAITIDIKANLNKEFYQKYILVKDPEYILENIIELKKKGIHVEVTDLVIPEYGDKLEDAQRFLKRIYDELGPTIPIHFLRFHPLYKFSFLYPTPVKTLEKHIELAKNIGFYYVYIGNVHPHPNENTYCPECGNPVIKREGFFVYEINLDENNRCKFCGGKIEIVGKAQISKIVIPRILIEKPIKKKE